MAAFSLCPSCDRYTGPAAKCPYCNTNAGSVPVIRLLRIIAIILSLGGLVLLYAAVRHREPPLITVNQVTPSMNFAHVRVAGEIQRPPYVSEDGQYAAFTVNDGTGQIRVAAYRAVASGLVHEHGLPHQGDQVEVRGNLGVSADCSVKLFLRSATHLVVLRASQKVIK